MINIITSELPIIWKFVKSAIDLLAVWVLLYYGIMMFKTNMRTMQLFKGVIVVLLVKAITSVLGLVTLGTIVDDVEIITDCINLGDMYFKIYETPGHAKGSCLYYYEQENALFTGDTLFRGGCGRIDFPTGNQSAMIQSLSKIKQFILT